MNRHLKSSILILLAIIASLSSFAQATNKLSAVEFEKRINEVKSPQLVDVRTKEEYNEGHLRDAVNIDYNSLDFDRLIDHLDKGRPTFVYCLSGGRSTAAMKELSTKGFVEVYELEGGIRKWKQAGKVLEESKKTSSEITRKEFDKIIKEEKFVLVDFGAKWCGPCKKMDPSIEKLSKDKDLKIRILKIDVDVSEKLSQELGISLLPTLHIYKNSKLVWQGEGYKSEEDLRKIIKQQVN